MAKINEAMIERLMGQVGGRANIILCGNCMTRLRLTLKERALVERDQLKRLDGVMGVIEGDDQLQIVLGPGKAQTAAEMMNALMSRAAPENPADGRDLSAIHQFFSKFATIFTPFFTPLIPGFIAAGLLLGIATLLEQGLASGGEPPG